MNSAKGFVLKSLDIFFLLRPPLLCASCSFFFAGVAGAAKDQIVGTTTMIVKIVPNLVLFILVTGIAFVLNQIVDVESDRLNRKLFIMPSGLVSRLQAELLALALVLATAALSLRRSALEIALVWSGVGLGALYSLPPLRLKSVPIADVVSNSIGFGWMGFMLGWLGLRSMDRNALVLSCGYATAMAGIFLNTLIADEDGDRMIGDRTTCVALGSKRVSRAAFGLILLAGIIAFVGSDGILWIGIAGSVPSFIALLVEPSRKNSVVASQVTAWIFIILLGLKVPTYLAMAFGVFVLSRIYYRLRFGLIYPTFA